MSRRIALRTFLLCLIAGLALALVMLAFSRVSARRARALDVTTAEIRRGNYLAWVQARLWSDALTLEERRALGDACRQYASTKNVLYADGNTWPPEALRSQVTHVFALRRYLRRAAGDLEYDVMCWPAFNALPVDLFQWMIQEWN